MDKETKDTLQTLFTAIQIGIGSAVSKFYNDTPEDKIPSDKWVIHAIVMTALTLAQKIGYPFQNVLVAQLSLITSRQEAHLLVDATFDNAMQKTSKQLLS